MDGFYPVQRRVKNLERLLRYRMNRNRWNSPGSKGLRVRLPYLVYIDYCERHLDCVGNPEQPSDQILVGVVCPDFCVRESKRVHVHHGRNARPRVAELFYKGLRTEQTSFFIRECDVHEIMFPRSARQALIQSWQNRSAGPIIDDPMSDLSQVEVGSDDDRPIGRTGLRTDQIRPFDALRCLLTKRIPFAACLLEQPPDRGLT